MANKDELWEGYEKISLDALREARSDKVKEIVESTGSTEKIRVLSIGPGDSKLDGYIKRKMKLQWASYHAVEPSKKFLPLIQNEIKGWGIPCQIENTSFSEHYQFPSEETKYDLILMSSVLYYMENFGLAIEHARSKLEPTRGRLVIIMQTELGGAEMYKCHLQAFPEIKNTTFDYQMSHKDIMKELDRLNVPYKCDVTKDHKKTGIDMNELVLSLKSNETKEFPRHCYVDFMVQRDVRELPGWLQKQIYDVVLQYCVLDEDSGRYVFPDYFATIEVAA